MRTVLSPETWTEIREAYVRGASADQLARQWRISTSAIYRRAVIEGWAKQKRAAPIDVSPFTPAHRLPKDEPEDDGPDLVCDVLTGEIHEPGFLARMAIGASGEALRRYDFDEARTLIKLADDYARVADRGRKPNLHTVVRALFDRVYSDELFAVEEGEQNIVKDIYWRNMDELDAKAAARDAEAKALEGAPEIPEESLPTPAEAC